MTVFTIDESNNIAAFSTPEEAAAATQTPFDSFTSEQELTELIAGWPAERLLACWNSLPGVKPTKKLKDPMTAAKRIWARIQGLGEAAKPETQPANPKGDKKARRGAQAAKGAPTKGKPTRKATPAKNAPKAKKAAKAKETSGPREGSKTAQVVAMLQRKSGATLAEIMKATKWKAHSCRGFISGTLGKKMGRTVESTKRDDGERVYQLKG